MYIHRVRQPASMYIHSWQLITCYLFRFFVPTIVAPLEGDWAEIEVKSDHIASLGLIFRGI